MGHAKGVPSCWVNGLRNGYKSFFDAQTNRLIVAEVGGNNHQTAWEDVHILNSASGGTNMGWPLCEGLNCEIPGLDQPVFAYPHNGDSACLVGGVVYRGPVSAGDGIDAF